MSKIVVDSFQVSGGGQEFILPRSGTTGQVLTLGANNTLTFGDKGSVVVTTNPTTATIYPLGTQLVNVATGEIFTCLTNTNNTSCGWLGSFGTYIGLTGYVGQQAYTSGGSYSFVVPANVGYISAVCVGAGGGGYYNWSNSGGGGGALAYANRIAVTPGETLTVVVGSGGTWGSSGGDSYISRSGSVFFTAQGGKYSATSTRAAYVSGTVTCLGGHGGLTSGNGYGGGGGAGGYSGNGGDGCYGTSNMGQNGGNASGGGGGGGTGYQSSTYGFGGGGGVGLYGEGVSGQSKAQQFNNNVSNSWGYFNGSDYNTYNGGGNPGSGGEYGAPNNNSSVTQNGRTMYHGEGGRCGGGGAGGGTSVSGNGNFCRGGDGGVRIIWGPGRAFPSTNTTDK